jgi:hypothetical protein
VACAIQLCGWAHERTRVIDSVDGQLAGLGDGPIAPSPLVIHSVCIYIYTHTDIFIYIDTHTYIYIFIYSTDEWLSIFCSEK